MREAQRTECKGGDQRHFGRDARICFARAQIACDRNGADERREHGQQQRVVEQRAKNAQKRGQRERANACDLAIRPDALGSLAFNADQETNAERHGSGQNE